MTTFTVKSLASRWLCSENCIYELINRGHLKAMTLTPSRRRPTYRILSEVVEAYEVRMRAAISAPVRSEGVVREFV